MKEQKVNIINKQGEKLTGIETLPENLKGKAPAVILVHGFAAGKDEYGMFTSLIKPLSELGIATYRFDFSGVGESEGDFRETTLTKLSGELEKILEFVKTQPNVDIKRIAIIAQSLGTCVTLALQPRVKCIVLIGSVGRPKETLVSLFGLGHKPQGESFRTLTNGKVVYLNPSFWKDFDNYNLLTNVGKLNCPVLFVHGGADDRVPLTEMELLFASAKEPKEKTIILGNNHNMRPHLDKLNEAVIKWLTENLV
ncbi:MAG: alpha/beta fold hydrolase [Candidatus Micrarchaeota archaeon]